MAKDNTDKVESIKRMIRFTGLLFIAAGFYAWLKPDDAAGYFNGIDTDDIDLIAKIFLAVGFIDLIVVPKLLDMKDK